MRRPPAVTRCPFLPFARFPLSVISLVLRENSQEALRHSIVIKSQLVINVAGQIRRIRQDEVDEAVNAILDRIASALAHGDRVELRGFGSFSVKVREGYVGRDPRTGVTVKVPKRKLPAFRQGIELRKRLNSVPMAVSQDRSGPGYLNRISASIGGASAGVKLPSGRAAA
jgi:integration host factor subunit beta